MTTSAPVCVKCRGERTVPCTDCSSCGCLTCAGTKRVLCPACTGKAKTSAPRTGHLAPLVTDEQMKRIDFLINDEDANSDAGYPRTCMLLAMYVPGLVREVREARFAKECAATPLMADVMRERDALRAELAEAKAAREYAEKCYADLIERSNGR